MSDANLKNSAVSSDMAARVGAFDWSATPLGARESWPQALRVAVDICLNSRLPMFVWWGPQLINIYNDGYAPVLGKRHPDALGQPARNIWADIWPQIADDVERVIVRGEPIIKERVRFLMERNGYTEETFFTYSHSPIPDGVGGIGGLFQVCSDETARVRAERERTAELVEANEKFQAVYDQGLFAGLIDLQGRLIDANQSSLVQCGFMREDVIGKLFWECGWWNRSPEIQAWVRHAYEQARSGVPFRGESRYFIADGSERWVSFAMMPIRNGAGEIIFIVPTGIDVTDRRRADHERRATDVLRESELRFRQMADTLPQMVWVTRPDGYHEYYNRRWYEFTGVPVGSTDGEGWNGMFHPDDQPIAWARWRHSLATGEPYEVEYRLRHHSGEYRWTLGRALPIRNDGGQIVRWFGTCTDIDRLKRLTAEREQLLERERIVRDEAEAASRAKDKFLAVLSHELRTPLSPVVMTIPSIECDPELPAKFREDLAMVRRNVDLEVKLIDDLLDLSRVTTGKLRLVMQPIRVHEVLDHAMRNSLSDVLGKRLDIRNEYRATDDRAIADPARLQQVFWNLLRNAVKFTREGGQVIVRSWNSSCDETGARFVNVEVHDNGVGIEPHALPRVFDAFEQGDARITGQFGGLGLGLAIAKAVVEMHGGLITAHSEGRNRGARFVVRLANAVPRGTMPRDGKPFSDASPDDEIAQPRGRSRVLLVEDHLDTVRTLARLLDSAGFEVKTATSAASALQLAGAEPFDIIVSDIGLPDSTGYELMREIRDRHGIAGIALSGYGMEEDMRQSRDAGFVDHVVKPVNVAHLEAVIRRVTMK